MSEEGADSLQDKPTIIPPERAPGVAERLSLCWARGPRPVLSDFLAREGPLSPSDLVAVLHIDQHHRWLAGERVPVEDYLNRYPVPDQPELMLELVHGEAIIRAAVGEEPDLEEYQRRFPQLAERLRILFEANKAWSAFLKSMPPIAPRSHTPAPRIPGYEILGELGEGGMGVVYKARQMNLDRIVALKMIRAGNFPSESTRARFLTEAAVVASLRHPNIVQIHELGEHEGIPWFSLEFCPGGSLAGHTRSQPQPPQQAAAALRVLAGAVQAAHRAGIIHRDLKPANVLLQEAALAQSSATAVGQEGQVGQAFEALLKITDFGLAKRLDVTGQTEANALLGTPPYMAPEQVRGAGEAYSPAVDIYALGAMLYELLTGRPPFLGATTMDTLQLVLIGDLVPPRRLQPGVPSDLETICLKCLQFEPAARYSSAQDLADDLGRFLEGRPIHARPVGVVERTLKWMRRRPAVAALSAAVLVVATIGLSGVLWKWRGEYGQRILAQQAEDQALQSAQAERTAREEAQQHLAHATVALAQREWQAGNLPRALQVLDDCPVDRRRWEWHHLRRLCQGSRLSFAVGEYALLSPDGRLVVVRQGTFHFVVKELATGKTGPKTLGGTIAFDDRGRRLVLSHVWNLGVFDLSMANPKTRERLLKTDPSMWLHREWNVAALSRDGRLLAVGRTTGMTTQKVKGGPDRIVPTPGEAVIWDVEKGKPLHTLPASASPVRCLALTPDGKTLVTVSESSPGTIRVWDTTEGKEKTTLSGPRAGVTSLVVGGPAGHRLAATGADGLVQLWENVGGASPGPRGMLLQPTLSATFSGHQGTVDAAAFSPDGLRLATGGQDRIIRIWDVRSSQQVFSLRGHQRPITQLAFTADGRSLVSYSSRTVRVWDVERGPASQYLPGEGPTRSVVFSPDGRWIGVGCEDGRAHVHPWPARGPVLHLGGEQWARPLGDFSGLGFTSDSKMVSAVFLPPDRRPPQLALHDLPGGQRRQLFKLDQGVAGGVAFSRDGEQLATTGTAGPVKLWDVRTGKLIHTFSVHKDFSNSAAFSRDGRMLATTSLGFTPDSGGVSLISLPSGKSLLQQTETAMAFQAALFSPDDRLLAWVHPPEKPGGSGEAVVWDLAAGKVLHRLGGHVGAVAGLAFHPDGDRLATSDDEGTITLWDVSSGRQVLSLPGRGRAWGLAFSPDGHFLARGLTDGAIEVLDARPRR